MRRVKYVQYYELYRRVVQKKSTVQYDEVRMVLFVRLVSKLGGQETDDFDIACQGSIPGGGG